MTRKDPQLNLRLPADLKEMLETAATANNRSLTAETVERLRSSFSSEKSSGEALFLLSRLEMRLTEAQLESLRYYHVATNFVRYLQTLQRLKDHPDMPEWPDEAAGGLDQLIHTGTKVLKLDEFAIDVAGLAALLKTQHDELARKTELMLEGMTKK